MECPWRQTLASVFLLLSPHSFLCQNVVPTEPLPTLPLLKEPLKKSICVNPGSQQQINLISSPSGFFSEFLPQTEYTKPEYTQTCAVQANTGPMPQGGAVFGNSQINKLRQIQSPVCNPITNMPTSQAPLNIISPTPSITNLSPTQPLSYPGQIVCPNFDTPPVTNSLAAKSLQPKISLIPVVSNLQNQIVLCSQRSLGPKPGSALNVPSETGFLNQNSLLPLVSNSQSQAFVQPPVSVTCKLMTDLTSLNFLPTPNIPKSVPAQNFATIPQAPVQSMAYLKAIIPADCMSNTPVSPNCQVSDLPPVFVATAPQFNNNLCRSDMPISEEYTPVPINLQINVPPPTIPEPKITIITAYPPAPPVSETPNSSDEPLGLYPPYPLPPLPPIIIESRRSKAKSWLPLILIALLADDGCCGGCCSCCRCGCSNSDIPIPYPIPIPTNNPIIIGGASKTRKKASN